MDELTQSLVDRAQMGDEAAMTELFVQHRERLKRMVRVRMDRRVQARVSDSDVLQEAFVDLANQLPNYAKSPDLPFFLWLRRLTGQRLAKIHRFHLGQQKRNAALEVSNKNLIPDASSVFVAAQLADQMTSAAGRAIRAETQKKVEQVLETMSPGDREIISLRNIEQLSNAEIALILGISNKAASKRYTRAILRVKSVLEGIPGMLD